MHMTIHMCKHKCKQMTIYKEIHMCIHMCISVNGPGSGKPPVKRQDMKTGMEFAGRKQHDA